jgi:hypothetical protein
MMCSTIAATVFAMAAIAFAQTGAIHDAPGTIMGALDRFVPGAPFSAELVTESIRTLADGTHISRTSTMLVARDSMGRVRHSQNLSPINTASPGWSL